jgi:2-haloacid dehalogenase
MSEVDYGGCIMTRRSGATTRREFLQAGAIAMIGAEVGAGRVIASSRAQAPSRSNVRPASIKALVFDTFGTVVDWRTSVTQEVSELAKRKGFAVDGAAFADAWRAQYGPMMDRVRRRELPWTKLDDLHRMILDTLLVKFKMTGLSEAEIDTLNRAWHRLKPWPDAVTGLTRLKRKFIIAPLSNGNIALMTELAKHAGLPWDCILGAELVRHYKPDPEVYLSAPEILDLKPAEVMMVAAHLRDLAPAKHLGLSTGFVARPLEYGPNGKPDLIADASVDLPAKDFNDLAAQLGA